MTERAKVIVIKSQAQLEMLRRAAADPAEARRRGMTAKMAQASLDAHEGGGPGRMPKRLGPLRANRHRAK